MKDLYSFRRLLVFILILFSPALLFAQEERKLMPVSGTYALTQVNIIQAPGKRIDRGTVIIKNGLIQSVGKDLTIPPDAIVIKGDTLHVYAGFIDGLSHTGVSKPKEEPKEKITDPGNPPPDRAGIMPETDVRTFINPADKSIEEFRNLGFTAAHIVPYGKMLPGTGALILLGGNAAGKMVLVPQMSLYSEFTTAERIYPNTVLAIMAKWRELYKRAAAAKGYETLYAANRNGLERPATDRILEAFYPVIDKRLPVMFNASAILEVQRAMILQKDLGFSLMLGDVKEGWDLVSTLRTSGTKVFLSLDLPEEKKEEKKETKKTEEQLPKSMTDEEKAALEKRQEEFIARYTGQALAFQKEGVPFGFSAMSVKSKDVKANLRRMIKAGMTEDQLLAALTTSPARLLGLSDRLGSIDPGKIANLVVTDKPYFDEKASVRYVFVDGIMYKIDASEKSKTEPKVLVDVAGGWTVVIETPEGKSEEKLTLKKDGENYSGTISGGRLSQPTDLDQVALDGSALRYKYSVEMSGQRFSVEVDAVVEGESFKGTANIGQFGSYPVEGKKEPNRK